MKKGMQRHVDPEVQEKEFEAWKEGEEYKEWQKLLEIKEATRAELKTEYSILVVDITLDDLSHPWSRYLVQMKKLMALLKVPSKTAAYEQDKLRSAFFAQQAQNAVTIDLFTFQIPQAAAIEARDCRGEFINIWKGLDEINDMQPDTYKSIRNNMVKMMGAFDKFYVKLVKNSHSEIYNTFLMPIIQPMVDVVATYKELYAVEHRNHPKKKWFVDPAPDFRLKACRKIFFDKLTALQAKMRDIGILTAIMDVKKCFEDVEIDTSPSVVLQYFLHPLKKAWADMCATLRKMHKNTVNLIRQPLEKNVEFVTNLKNLITWYQKCEALLGDDLKKDQLMFMHGIISHVFLSPLGSHLGADDEEEEHKEDQKKKRDDVKLNTLAQVIPSIAAFQGLRHMANSRLMMEQRKKELEELGDTLESIKLPKKHVLFSQDTEERFEGLPRIWMWEGFVPDKSRDKWLTMSDEVGSLNIMVQEDIVDFFITSIEGKKKAQKHPEERRPPFIWNFHVYENEYVYPREELKLPSDEPPKKATEQEEIAKPEPLHKFRPYANPNESYEDGRVNRIVKEVERMGGELKIRERDRWDLLVREVIRTMKRDPPPLEEEEISEDEALMQKPQEMEIQEESKEIDS